MRTYARAKINAVLNVVCRREDGYHELEMIMLPLTFVMISALKKQDVIGSHGI